MRVVVGIIALLVGTGCSLPRGVLSSIDGGSIETDTGPGIDAGPDHDAAGIDAARDDGGPEHDAGTDAGADVGTDAGCIGTPETCNGRDDDCNDAVDDGVTCRRCTAPGACGDCTRIEVEGRVYQSCDAASGTQYWARICWTLGSGYDLAALETQAERDGVRSALQAAAIRTNHWIGLTDRETDGTYQWVDGHSLGWAPTFNGGNHVEEGFVVMNDDGNFEDYPITWSHRVLCELGESRCDARTDHDSTCDGADDDCDGFVDEDCDGEAVCDSRVFGSSVYYWCRDDMTQPEATTECTRSGAQLASLNDRFEREFVDGFATEGDAWVGLVRDGGATSSSMGWRWVDGTPFPSTDPDWTAMWRGADPNGDADVRCAVCDTGLQDETCGSSRQETVCERPVTR